MRWFHLIQLLANTFNQYVENASIKLIHFSVSRYVFFFVLYFYVFRYFLLLIEL